MALSEKGVQRFEVRTSDRDVAVAAVNAIAAHRPRVTLARTGVRFEVRSVSYQDFGADLVRVSGARYVSAAEPMDSLLGGVFIGGTGTLTVRDHEMSMARHDGFLYPVGTPYLCDYDNPNLAVVRLPWDYVARTAQETTGLSAADLRLESHTPISEQMRRNWTDTVAFLCRQLTGPVAPPPLIVEQLLRLGAVTALNVFANTTMTAARLPEPGRAAPAAVRRAVAFIDEHAEQPLTVTQVAAAAGISARALQTAFRRHLDTTPLAHLRTVRLAHAHRELQAADPADGTTVAAIAHRWGFGNLGRFAQDYRITYGQLPSRTLLT